MQTATRAVGSWSYASGRARTVLVVACSVLAVLLAVDARRQLNHVDHRGDEARASRTDPSAAGGETADPFRRFRQEVGPGARFALVFGPDVDRDQRGFYRLFAGYFLYPAIAVAEPGDADAVMVFGSPSSELRASFEELATVDGVWLARRAG